MTRDRKKRPEVGQGMDQRGLRLTMDEKKMPERTKVDQGWEREA